MNVRTHDAIFRLGKVTVWGSFLTEVHFVMTNGKETLRVSYDSARLNDQNYAFDMVNGTCGDRYFRMGPHTERTCAGATLAIDYSTLTVLTTDWEVRVTGQPVYNRQKGPRHRLDLRISLRVDEGVLMPHGIVGQSFDNTHQPRFGAVDIYPPRDRESTFVTRAMAEGAIERNASAYEMRSPYDTAFFASRYARMRGDASPTSARPTLAYVLNDDEKEEHERRRLSGSNCCAQGELTYSDVNDTVTFRTVLWLQGTLSGPSVDFNGDIGVQEAQSRLNSSTPANVTSSLGVSGRKVAGAIGIGARLFSYSGQPYGGQSGLLNEEGYLTQSGNRAWYTETDANGYIEVYALVTVP